MLNAIDIYSTATNFTFYALLKNFKSGKRTETTAYTNHFEALNRNTINAHSFLFRTTKYSRNLLVRKSKHFQYNL